MVCSKDSKDSNPFGGSPMLTPAVLHEQIDPNGWLQMAGSRIASLSSSACIQSVWRVCPAHACRAAVRRGMPARAGGSVCTRPDGPDPQHRPAHLFKAESSCQTDRQIMASLENPIEAGIPPGTETPEYPHTAPGTEKHRAEMRPPASQACQHCQGCEAGL